MPEFYANMLAYCLGRVYVYYTADRRQGMSYNHGMLSNIYNSVKLSIGRAWQTLSGQGMT